MSRVSPAAVQRRLGINKSEEEITTNGPANHFGLSEMAQIKGTIGDLTDRRMKKARSNYNSLAAHKGLTERAGPPIKLGTRKGPDWQYGPQGYLAPTQRQPSPPVRRPGTAF